MMRAVALFERVVCSLIGKQRFHSFHLEFHFDFGGKFGSHFRHGITYVFFGVQGGTDGCKKV